MAAKLIETKPQVIKEQILDKAMEDEGIEAIFANCQESEYLEQMIMLCIARYWEARNARSKADSLDRDNRRLYTGLSELHSKLLHLVADN